MLAPPFLHQIRSVFASDTERRLLSQIGLCYTKGGSFNRGEYIQMIAKRFACFLLAFSLVGVATACGVSADEESNADGSAILHDGMPEADVSEGEKIINVGVTDSLGSVNPFMIDQTEIGKYAIDLVFLPLVELDQDMNFQGMLADSITTEDKIHFVVHIDDDAVWSDGTPVTAYDVEYSVLRYASPVVGNTTLSLQAFEGTDDETGFVNEGAVSMEGLEVLDDKTVQFTCKYPMTLLTFQDAYGRYLHVLPKHVIEKFAEDELISNDWFNRPDVISGPYFLTEYDPEHYISYTANVNYWKGAPKIDRLNIEIMDGSQIYSGLQSGAVDITHHTLTTIPQEDYESIERLDNVKVTYGAPVTTQSAFIQTANIPDARVRQAMLYAIDRQQLVDRLLKGHGEVSDGFLTSASPYYDESLQPVEYDPEKARALLEDAGWDSTRILRFYVNSDDHTFASGVRAIVQQWSEVGINAQIIEVDLAALMEVAGTADYDIMAVQYSYTPVDPYPDIEWLLSGEGSWTGYYDEEIAADLEAVQQTDDIARLRDLYSGIDRKMQQDVPMFSIYVTSGQGAVNKRVKGVEPCAYGFFNDVQNWDVTQ